MGGLGLRLPADREDRDPELEPCSPPRAVLRLRGAVQHYEWGGRGDASLVARLAGETAEGRPCAELWMGTHPSAPSSLAPDAGIQEEVSLREWLARNPAALLGRAVAARWGGDLPFLFKVLSVAQPLSIQAHPDRDLARALHSLRPATYRDANHKPEMAVAVTEFRALCGFVTIQVRECPPAFLAFARASVVHDVLAVLNGRFISFWTDLRWLRWLGPAVDLGLQMGTALILDT
jgi:mannose-6-phosphate isomerase